LRRAASRSTARNTSWPPTTGRTICTAASRVSTNRSGVRRSCRQRRGPAAWSSRTPARTARKATRASW
jgi:hypothetical protein